MRSTLIGAVVLATLVAGCLGGSPTRTTETVNDSPEVVEDPDNYTYVDNASLENGGHVHDYWDGQDELPVMDRTDNVGQLSINPGENEPEQIAIMRPPSGGLVPQGTETVRVTIDWEHRFQGSVYENPQLWVRKADDNAFHHVADVSAGDTVEIPSTNDENDLPHRSVSAWAFALYVEPVADSGTLWHQANVTMEVVAERGLPLPVFPAHPDHWDGRSEIDLVDDAPGLFVWDDENPAYGEACIGPGCSGPSDGAHQPTDGTIVPPGTKIVRVRLEPQTPSPTRVGLAYHGADTWRFERLDATTADGDTRIYDIPVTPETADGPYDEQSVWRFMPYISDPVEDGVYAGGYRITAAAYKEPPG